MAPETFNRFRITNIEPDVAATFEEKDVLAPEGKTKETHGYFRKADDGTKDYFYFLPKKPSHLWEPKYERCTEFNIFASNTITRLKKMLPENSEAFPPEQQDLQAMLEGLTAYSNACSKVFLEKQTTFGNRLSDDLRVCNEVRTTCQNENTLLNARSKYVAPYIQNGEIKRSFPYLNAEFTFEIKVDDNGYITLSFHIIDKHWLGDNEVIDLSISLDNEGRVTSKTDNLKFKESFESEIYKQLAPAHQSLLRQIVMPNLKAFASKTTQTYTYLNPFVPPVPPPAPVAAATSTRTRSIQDAGTTTSTITQSDASTAPNATPDAGVHPDAANPDADADSGTANNTLPI